MNRDQIRIQTREAGRRTCAHSTRLSPLLTKGNENEPQENAKADGGSHHRASNASDTARYRVDGWHTLRLRIQEAAEILWLQEEGIIDEDEAKAHVFQIFGGTQKG